jgi:hypothetical protein
MTEKLKCGCGGTAKPKITVGLGWFCDCDNIHCLLSDSNVFYTTEDEAIAAFRRATNQDKAEKWDGLEFICKYCKTVFPQSALYKGANSLICPKCNQLSIRTLELYKREQLLSEIAALTAENETLKKGGISWISVKDRLPEENISWYLLYNPNWCGRTQVEFYDSQMKYKLLDEIKKGTTHWAHINLPEKGGE